MKKLSTASLLGLLLLSTGCNDDTGTSDTDSGPGGDQQPRVSEWETVVDAMPFPTSGDTKIATITIGRKEFNGNFANRGNVEVLLDQDSDVITIEMQRYDFTDKLSAEGDGTEDNEGSFKRLKLWAYSGGQNPKKPAYGGELDCTAGAAWKDGCAVIVWYDGQTQPARAGAHLRVHLPKAYRGDLNVQTEDNENETTYPIRGDVTITDWCSGGSVKMSAGTAKIKLCDNLSPAPKCPKAQADACETFKDPETDEDAAWATNCGCPVDLYGQMRIESLEPWAADITVDMPASTWMNVTISNEGDLPNECTVSLENCSGDACVKREGEPNKPNDREAAEYNYPSPAATSGAGFNLTVVSSACTNVAYVADPDDWSPEATPKEELRGHVKVCTGCL